LCTGISTRTNGVQDCHASPPVLQLLILADVLTWVSLQNGAELASALCARLPAKIDIGPVYSVDPQQRKTLGGECHDSLHLP
jgi:hypothetical protein